MTVKLKLTNDLQMAISYLELFLFSLSLTDAFFNPTDFIEGMLDIMETDFANVTLVCVDCSQVQAQK